MGAGFTMTVLPVTRAGPILLAISDTGKFHGRIAPQTPMGCLTIMPYASFVEILDLRTAQAFCETRVVLDRFYESADLRDGFPHGFALFLREQTREIFLSFLNYTDSPLPICRRAVPESRRPFPECALSGINGVIDVLSCSGRGAVDDLTIRGVSNFRRCAVRCPAPFASDNHFH